MGLCLVCVHTMQICNASLVPFNYTNKTHLQKGQRVCFIHQHCPGHDIEKMHKNQRMPTIQLRVETYNLLYFSCANTEAFIWFILVPALYLKVTKCNGTG